MPLPFNTLSKMWDNSNTLIRESGFSFFDTRDPAMRQELQELAGLFGDGRYKQALADLGIKETHIDFIGANINRFLEGDPAHQASYGAAIFYKGQEPGERENTGYLEYLGIHLDRALEKGENPTLREIRGRVSSLQNRYGDYQKTLPKEYADLNQHLRALRKNVELLAAGSENLLEGGAVPLTGKGPLIRNIQADYQRAQEALAAFNALPKKEGSLAGNAARCQQILDTIGSGLQEIQEAFHALPADQREPAPQIPEQAQEDPLHLEPADLPRRRNSMDLGTHPAGMPIPGGDGSAMQAPDQNAEQQNGVVQPGQNAEQPDSRTEIDRFIEDLEQVDAAGHTDTEDYKDMLRSLRDLSDATRPYYARRPDGSFPPLKKEDYHNILGIMNRAQMECDYYLSEKDSHRRSAFGEARRYIVTEVNEFLKKDIEALQNMKDPTGKSLAETIEQGRAEKLMLEKNLGQANTIGNHMSSRIPISYKDSSGKVRRGFFTRANYVDAFKLNEQQRHILRLAGIGNGSRIDTKNVGMSRIARLLDMGDVIAHSETMEIKGPDGRKIRGTFMETAEGGDIYQLKGPDDPMRQIAKPKCFDTESFKKQAADMQILDYICGNMDRHEGNVIYKTKTTKEGTVVIGFKGIDNDSSFGSNDASSSAFRNLDFRIMREETAKKVLNLTEDVLRVQLHGLGMNLEDLDAAWSRTRTLQDKIRRSMEHYRKNPDAGLSKKYIKVLKDSEMNRYSMEELGREPSKNGKGAVSENIFGAMFGCARYVGISNRNLNTDLANAEKKGGVLARKLYWEQQNQAIPIKYNEARSLGKQAQRTSHGEEKEATVRELQNKQMDISQSLERLNNQKKYFGHRDTGSYKWMKGSLDRLTREQAEILAKPEYQDPARKLSPEDSRRIQRLYEDVARSARNYMDAHPKNPSSDMGITRKGVAEQLKSLQMPGKVRLGFQKLSAQKNPGNKENPRKETGIKRSNSMSVPTGSANVRTV